MESGFLRSRTGLLLIGVVFSWVVFAIVFGAFDLEISLSIVDESSGWGALGDTYGRLPGFGLISISASVYVGGFFRNLHRQKIPGYLSIVFGILYTAFGLMRSDQDDWLLGISFIFPTVLFIILTWRKNWTNYRALSAIVLIIAIFDALLFVEISKTFFGRVRFRDLAPDYSNFTPWFIPRGITGGRSFPSGHAAMGCMLFPLLILLRHLSLKDIRKLLMVILVVSWALFVGLSRVVVGAHFASDVLFPVGLAAVLTILFYRKFYLR